jgi:hypothetical protein
MSSVKKGMCHEQSSFGVSVPRLSLLRSSQHPMVRRCRRSTNGDRLVVSCLRKGLVDKHPRLIACRNSPRTQAACECHSPVWSRQIIVDVCPTLLSVTRLRTLGLGLASPESPLTSRTHVVPVSTTLSARGGKRIMPVLDRQVPRPPISHVWHSTPGQRKVRP